MVKPVMWTEDKALSDAQRNPAWATFHRECGRRDVFFVVERAGEAVHRSAAVRYEQRGERWFEHTIAACDAVDPISAVVASFHAARAAGCDLPVELVAALRPVVAPALDFDDLLGGAAAAPKRDIVLDLVG